MFFSTLILFVDRAIGNGGHSLEGKWARIYFPMRSLYCLFIINKENGKICLIDAKFKKMSFENQDVDNPDLRQLHSYSYYFQLKYPNKFGGDCLVYSSRCRKPKGIKKTSIICMDCLM